MKIYIGTDLEGISGIDCIEMIQPGDSRYLESIERLMADLNAEIDGAFAGGATHVTVSDGHCTGKNFDISLLDPRAELDEARGEKMDAGYDGAFIIGAHAMAGTLNGFLDHTQSFENLVQLLHKRRKSKSSINGPEGSRISEFRL